MREELLLTVDGLVVATAATFCCFSGEICLCAIARGFLLCAKRAMGGAVTRLQGVVVVVPFITELRGASALISFVFVICTNKK